MHPRQLVTKISVGQSASVGGSVIRRWLDRESRGLSNGFTLENPTTGSGLLLRIGRWIAVLSCLLSAGTAYGADPIAKYLEPSTVCVVRINLQELDLTSYAKAIQEILPGVLPPEAIGGVQAAVGAALQELRAAGAKELYVTLSAIELTSGKACLVIPCDDVEQMTEQLQNLIGILPPVFGYSVYQGSGAVVACTEDVWTRLQATTQADSRNLLQAIEEHVDLGISMSVAVRDSLRETVADIWPDQLPSWSAVEISPKQLITDVQAVHMGIASSPQLRVVGGVTCVDDAAANRTLVTLKRLQSTIKLSLPIAKSGGGRLAVELDAEQIGTLIRHFTPNFQNRTASMQHSNNLKQLGLAVHQFEGVYGGFPPRMTVNPQGQPLLSWRVHLLPFIGERALYEEFRLDEPWFSQHNKRMVERMPETYRLLTDPGLEGGMTCMQTPQMAGSFWGGSEDRLLTFRDIPDGTSNTVCFVIASREQAVIWTQPEDLQIAPDRVKEDLFGDRDSMQVVFFDGSVQMIGNSLAPEIYRSWLTHAGGEKIQRP